MDNTINSVLTPGLSTPTTENTPSGVISELPPALKAVKTGDSLLLQTLIDNNAFELGKSSNTSLLIGETTIPINLKLNQPLPPVFDPEQPHQLVVRVTSRLDNNLTVQLVSVDNQKPTHSGPLPATNSAPSPALTPTAGAVPAVPLLPLKLKPAIEQLLNQQNFPAALRQQVLTALPDLQLYPVITSLGNPTSPQSAAVGEPLLQALSLLKNHPDPKTAIANLVNQLTKAVSQPLPAVVTVNSGLRVLDTPLGQIVPELPLKLEPGTELLLAIKDVIAAPATEPLSQLLAALNKLLSALPQSERPLQQLLNSSAPEPSLAPLLKLLSPLQNSPTQATLAADLLNKIPTGDAKMLANLHAFYKAATSGKVSDWLGEKLTTELSRAGSEGQAVLARATDFVNNSTRDGQAWRIVEMPFFDGSTLARIKLALRKNGDEEEDGTPDTRSKSGVRFLLETNFTRLGSFQFDGFTLAADRRFDLVIRTSRPLETDMVSQMMNLFKTSLHDVNYVGNININMQENFIRIPSGDTNQLNDGIYI